MIFGNYDTDIIRKNGTLLYTNTYRANSCSDDVAFVEDKSDTTTATELGIEVWNFVEDVIGHIIIIKYANNRDNIYECKWVQSVLLF